MDVNCKVHVWANEMLDVILEIRMIYESLSYIIFMRLLRFYLSVHSNSTVPTHTKALGEGGSGRNLLTVIYTCFVKGMR